jgi:poly(3-hydroxybutyrate) depolymerase
VFHGDRDTTVNPRNGEQVLGQALALSAADGPKRTVSEGRIPNGHTYTRSLYRDARGDVVGEHWLVHGAGHAWSGGSPGGSFTDPRGPDASKEMLRFFREHPKAEPELRPSD